MSTTQHPLTEADAVELWDGHVPLVLNFRVWTWGDRRGILTALRAAFDAGREHERTITPADPHHDPRPWQDCTHEDIREGDLVERLAWDLVRIGVAHHQDEDGDWFTRDGMLVSYAGAQPLRRIPAHTTEKETPMPETTPTAEPLARTILAVPEGYGAPHHDASRIKAGDYVLQVGDGEDLCHGKAHYQDDDGDWWSEDDHLLTWDRSDRPDAVTVWPAPTPPAEEVKLPGEDGAILLDVEALDPATDDVHRSNKTVYLYGRWFGIDSHTVEEIRIWPTWITAFTLPDGTRARRDGERPNGEPRFVKTQEV